MNHDILQKYKILSKAQQVIEQHCSKTSPIVVACSGGLDSVMLVHTVGLLEYTNVHLAYVHHGMRPYEETKRDELVVQSLAQQYQFMCHTHIVDVVQYAQEKKCSLETSARILRYSWLEQLRSSVGAQWILTGHHKTDVVETLLFNMTRGSGLLHMQNLKKFDRKRLLLRPFHDLSKTDLLLAAQEGHVLWVEDQTNQDMTIKRNFIRQEVVPVLSSLNENTEEHLYQVGQDQLEVEEYFQMCLSQKLGENWQQQHIFQYQDLCALPHILLKVCIRDMIAQHEGTKGLTRSHITKIAEMLPILQSGKILHLGKIWGLRRIFNICQLELLEPTQQKMLCEKDFQEGTLFDRYVVEKGKSNEEDGYLCSLPLSMIQKGLVIRTRMPGDKVQKREHGKVYHSPIKNIFLEHRIPLNERATVPLIAIKNTSLVIAIPTKHLFFYDQEDSMHLFTIKTL